MRFGLVHRIMTDALAVLGLLALVTSGELHRGITIAIVLGLGLALATPERWQDHRFMRRVGVLAPLGLLAMQVGRLGVGAAVLPLAVEFAAGLQVVRLATRRGAAHDQQVVVLALLHLIAGTVLGGGITYGLCFIGFLIVAPGALVLSHLRREVEGNYRQGARDRTGLPVDVPRILRSRRVIGRQFLLFTCLLSVPIFLFTAVLFVMFPRVGLSLLLLNHGRPERMIGFSDKVDLGGVGKLRSDPTIAMRVEPSDLAQDPPLRIALYLRGTAFDQYDGRSWSRTNAQRGPADMNGSAVRIRRSPDVFQDKRLTIDLEPIDPPVVFMPHDAVALRLLGRGVSVIGQSTTVLAGPEGEFKYVSAEDRGLRYEVFLAGKNEAPARALSATERARYLTLPPGLPPRVADLAKSWTESATTTHAKAAAVEARLRTDYRYDLESPSGAEGNPLDHFLFESKRGHCEFYSTAMAVLLRTQGVPTRNVTGFVGGTFNRFGRYYAVRQGDAHSWVEVFLDGQGWLRFDPDPARQRRAPERDHWCPGVHARLRRSGGAALEPQRRRLRPQATGLLVPNGPRSIRIVARELEGGRDAGHAPPGMALRAGTLADRGRSLLVPPKSRVKRPAQGVDQARRGERAADRGAVPEPGIRAGRARDPAATERASLGPRAGRRRARAPCRRRDPRAHLDLPGGPLRIAPARRGGAQALQRSGSRAPIAPTYRERSCMRLRCGARRRARAARPRRSRPRPAPRREDGQSARRAREWAPQARPTRR